MKNNKLLNAIGTVDDRHIRAEEFSGIAKLADPGSANKSKSKKLRVVLSAAAAAAALAMCVGFSRLGDPRYRFKAGDGTGFYFEVKLKRDIIIPDEYRNTDMNDPVIAEKLPSELFKEFNVDLLINDNFSEELDFTPVKISNANGEFVEMCDINHPRVAASGNMVAFGYKLYSKKLDKVVTVAAEVFYNSHFESYGMEINGGEYEYITLKDGSDCYVDNSGAVFAHDGVKYSVGFEDKVGFDAVKQVLRDLGVL